MSVQEKLEIENNLLSIIKLYVESFMLENEKGFANKEEKKEKSDSFKREIYMSIVEKSKLFGISIEELLMELKKIVIEYETIDKDKEEWFFIEKLLGDWLKEKDNQEER